MAKRFTRNIRSIENIDKQSKSTNEQNDLLSDKKDVYVRNQNKYEKITGGVHQVNNKTPDDSGNVEINTGVMKVNGKAPNEQGNIDMDSIEKIEQAVEDTIKTADQAKSDVQSKADEASESIGEASKEVNTAKAEAIKNMHESDISDKNYLLDSKKRVLEARTSGRPADNSNYDTYFISEPIQAGVEFTVSGQLEITDGDFDDISIKFRDENDETIGFGSFSVDYSGGGFSETFTLSKTPYKMYIYSGEIGETRGNGVIYENVKLQLGSIATPWTPNPSEIITKKEYDKLVDAITNLGGSI